MSIAAEDASPDGQDCRGCPRSSPRGSVLASARPHKSYGAPYSGPRQWRAPWFVGRCLRVRCSAGRWSSRCGAIRPGAVIRSRRGRSNSPVTCRVWDWMKGRWLSSIRGKRRSRCRRDVARKRSRRLGNELKFCGFEDQNYVVTERNEHLSRSQRLLDIPSPTPGA
jgi:hypothetical protein